MTNIIHMLRNTRTHQVIIVNFCTVRPGSYWNSLK